MANEGRGQEEDTSFNTTKLFIYDQIPFLKQLEYSDYIIATSNANFDQESIKEEFLKYRRGNQI